MANGSKVGYMIFGKFSSIKIVCSLNRQLLYQGNINIPCVDVVNSIFGFFLKGGRWTYRPIVSRKLATLAVHDL